MRIFSKPGPVQGRGVFSTPGALNGGRQGRTVPGGYVALRTKTTNGPYIILSGLNPDGSRSNLIGKAS
ncbi:hypothetical protein [Bosea sp. ASV33]|uniref:hypothetical protein n=1 Tax=Bosea sp. ASV33 TaxID=2795106 RepID=UPI0018ED2275|nr:hypothetical protein [Bosea sp. ASV33]